MSQDAKTRRYSALFVAAVALANLAYWGWNWATAETFEQCLRTAAKDSSGVARAYADLRRFCEEKELERQIAALPPPKPNTQSAINFDDLIPPDKRPAPTK